MYSRFLLPHVITLSHPPIIIINKKINKSGTVCTVKKLPGKGKNWKAGEWYGKTRGRSVNPKKKIRVPHQAKKATPKTLQHHTQIPNYVNLVRRFRCRWPVCSCTCLLPATLSAREWGAAPVPRMSFPSQSHDLGATSLIRPPRLCCFAPIALQEPSLLWAESAKLALCIATCRSTFCIVSPKQTPVNPTPNSKKQRFYLESQIRLLLLVILYNQRFCPLIWRRFPMLVQHGFQSSYSLVVVFQLLALKCTFGLTTRTEDGGKLSYQMQLGVTAGQKRPLELLLRTNSRL